MAAQWNYMLHYKDDADDEDEENNAIWETLLKIGVVLGIEYCTIGMIHLILGILLEKRLRKTYPQFHAKYKNYLNTITVVLSIPLFLRGIVDLLDSSEDEKFDTWFYVDNVSWT